MALNKKQNDSVKKGANSASACELSDDALSAVSGGTQQVSVEVSGFDNQGKPQMTLSADQIKSLYESEFGAPEPTPAQTPPGPNKKK